MRFDGKRILVTGGTRGIGAATVRALLDAGAHVAIAGRGDASFDLWREVLAGENAIAVSGDVAGSESCKALVAAAIEGLRRKGFGRLLVDGQAVPFDDVDPDAVAGGSRLGVVVDRLVVRAGDFIGASSSSWFGQMVRPGRPVARVLNPAFAGVGHQWAYLPDVAATMRQLLERRAELPAFSVFHMRGYWDEDGRGMVQAIVRAVVAAGQPAPRVTRFPWWLVRAGAPVVPLFRELQEMRYLWEVPVRMDNDRLRSFLGREPATPLDDAVRTTLRALGCLG